MVNVIYGAGDYGKRCCELLGRMGIEVDFFCHTNDDGRSEYCGKPLKTIDYIFFSDEEMSIYIAISDTAQSRKIKDALLDRGGTRLEVYECGRWIYSNCTDAGVGRITYRNNNTYEEGVAISYWKPLFSETQKLDKMREALVTGLSADDVSQVDSIIKRMKAQPYRDEENDIFSAQERMQIRKVEREFQPRYMEDSRWGGVQAWNGWIFPIDAGMDPSVWYYRCGMESLRDAACLAGKSIIDAGAYIGDSSVVLSRYTDQNVYAFEAMRENYLRIDDVCRMNGIGNVIPVNRALSDRNGSERLFITPSHIGNGVVRREAISYEAEESVESVTIDDFVSSHHLEIGLIKADIEGGEPKMLRGAINVIKEQRPILMISIYHTANDFFGIKKIIEDMDSNYKFRIFQPYVRNRVIRDTMLICEPG